MYGKSCEEIYNKVDIEVHGGITYAEEGIYADNKEVQGWFIGWDYAHCYDYMGYEEKLPVNLRSGNDFFVFECTIGWMGKEIVDCIMYNCQREVYCYEIKQSVSDFHSKNKLTFVGNKNYFVMPYALYEKVKEELYTKEEYKDIGVYVSIKSTDTRGFTLEQWNEYNLRRQNGIYESGFDELVIIKRANRRELRADKEVILSSMLRSMQR